MNLSEAIATPTIQVIFLDQRNARLIQWCGHPSLKTCIVDRKHETLKICWQMAEALDDLGGGPIFIPWAPIDIKAPDHYPRDHDSVRA